jgi:sulfatase maturation enzyme AslB (radical SAM superfamily)
MIEGVRIMIKNHEDLNVIGVMEFNEYEEMYKIVDFLNKSLKDRGLIFGLKRENGKDKLLIYDSDNSSGKTMSK